MRPRVGSWFPLTFSALVFSEGIRSPTASVTAHTSAGMFRRVLYCPVSMPYPGLHRNRRSVSGTVSRNYRLSEIFMPSRCFFRNGLAGNRTPLHGEEPGFGKANALRLMQVNPSKRILPAVARMRRNADTGRKGPEMNLTRRCWVYLLIALAILLCQPARVAGQTAQTRPSEATAPGTAPLT